MRYFCKTKKIKGLRGDVLEYVAQVIPQIDAEIVKKSHLKGVEKCPAEA